VVLEGGALDDLGEVLEAAYVERCAAAGAEPVEATRRKERTKLHRAPTVLVVGAVRRPSEKVPWEEQVASAAAAAQNALLAATALGYGSMWRTGDPAYDDRVKAALGLRAEDAIIGFLYLGTASSGGAADGATDGGRRPDLSGLVEHRGTGAGPGGAA
jgi:nitroreductase